MVRFLHTADWQLGMTRYFLAGESQARFGQARLDAIATIAELVRDERCAFVVVCGDVFESNQVSRPVLARSLDAMAAVPAPVLLLPGNHDPLDAGSVYASPTFAGHRPPNVVVLDGHQPAEPVPGVQVWGAPWRSKRPLEDLVARACEELEPGGRARVLAGHGAVDVLDPSPDNPAQIRLAAAEEALAEGRVHYVALGDRHSTTSVGATGRIWYAGAPEATDYDEVASGRVLVVDLEPGSCDVREVPVGRWRFVPRSWSLDADADVEALEAWLAALPDKARTIVKLSLVGTLSLAAKARLDGVLERFAEVLGALETWERRSDLVVLASGADFSDLGLAGFAEAAAAALRERSTASAGAESLAAQDALALLYRLAQSR